MDRRAAEMIKYACNSFLALKISYMNEVAGLCEALGVDVEDVARGMRYDERIGQKFLNAGIGFGGSCLPKDTRAFVIQAGRAGLELKMVRAAIEVNDRQKTLLFRKARERLGNLGGVKAAVLGLTFKPQTDDLRDAPSVDNVALLLENGAQVTAYDPAGMENCRELFAEGPAGCGSIRYAQSPAEALAGADVCFIFTEWEEIRSLAPEEYRRRMARPLVLDGRNLYVPEDMRKAGVEYVSVGR